MDGMNVATRIELPIKISLSESREEVIGQFYASVGRDLDAINIQMYISNKDLARQHMSDIKNYYIEFMNKIQTEALLFGYDFMNTSDEEEVEPIVEEVVSE